MKPRYLSEEEEERRLKYQPRYTPSPPEVGHMYFVQKLVNDAIKQNRWLFQKEIKRWYTPEEYLEYMNQFSYDGSKDWEKIIILDPREGLLAADKMLEKLSIEVKDTTERMIILRKRVLDYYIKDKTKK